jgi:hypothetical protein
VTIVEIDHNRRSVDDNIDKQSDNNHLIVLLACQFGREGWQGMARKGVVGGFLGVASLLLVTSCAVPMDGSARPDPAVLQSMREPISGSTVFGDATTVDPCSVVDIGTVPAALHAALAPADGLDDCPVSATLADGTAVDVYVGPLETGDDKLDADPRGLSSLQRGMKLYEAVDNTPGSCDDYLKFQDDYWLLVNAITSDPNSKADTCPASEALVKNAATQIAAGAIRHRTYPNGSVGKLDPCTLVSNNTLTGVGLADAPPLEYPEQHECSWISNDGHYVLRVQFVVGQEPSVQDSATQSAVVLSGRKTVVTQYQESSSASACWAQTGLNKYGSSPDLVEIAMVEMRNGDNNMANACDRAQVAAATAVWPLLPPVNG